MTLRTDNITSLPDIKSTPRRSEAEIRLLLQRYMNNIIAADKVPPHGGNILHFFELVKNSIWSRQESEGISADKRLLVMGDDPPEEKEVDTEAITFYLDTREPGLFGKASALGGGSTVREIKYHVRSVQQHPEHVSEKLVTMGRSFDNMVVFNVYSRSDAQSVKRLLWFEDVMDSFSWYFGLHNMRAIYTGATRIGKLMVGQLPLAKYSVSYRVRTEDTYQFGSQELRRLVLNLDVSTD